MSLENNTIYITGSSGLIGNQLCNELANHNNAVIKLNRIKHTNPSLCPDWDLNQEGKQKSNSPDIIIHLAGENIGAKRWTKNQKELIYNSRVLGTRRLVDKICSLKNKPTTFICASAIGYYGDRGSEKLNENSAPGSNFSAKLSADWEKETQPLIELGIRVINLRFGVVLSQHSGALKKMLFPYKLGLGGSIGKGDQHFSWISINDAISAILYILKTPSLSGPINVTSPHPVTNKTFSKLLAQQLKRPAFFAMPAGMCRLLFGEMADELLLSSLKVVPDKLIDNGFKFSEPQLPQALKRVLS